MENAEPFRVLCLDGGGMRGVYQTAYLSTFASRLRGASREGSIDLGRAFHLISGTSTGGIVACALAAGEPLRKVEELYREHGRDIFPCQWVRALPGLGMLLRASRFGNRRGNEVLRTVLHATFKGKRVAEIYRERQIALAIPTLDINRHSAVVFKTPHFDV
jgi:uncharacterized protein